MIPEKGLFVGGRGVFARFVKAVIFGSILIGMMMILSYAMVGIGSQFGEEVSLWGAYHSLSSFGFHALIGFMLMFWVLNSPKGKGTK